MPQVNVLDATQRAAVEVLAGAQSFLLASHVRPDGDGIGAQAALARILLARGKDVRILNPDRLDQRFDFFTDGLEYGVYGGGPVPDHDVCVLLDISELSRCGELGEGLAAAASSKLVVDHHIHLGDEWWDHAFVDVSASATGLLVHRIARALGSELDPLAAAAIFTSIASDTGWFKYSNTDEETLQVAAHLVRRGVKPFEVYRALHQRQAPEQPGMLSSMLARAEFHGENRIVVVDLPSSMAHVSEHVDSDLALDVLRAVEAVEVVVYLRELPEGGCKLSLRSKTDFDVNAIARRFGGGGHKKASGATIAGSLADVKRAVLAAVVAGLELFGGAR